VDYDEIARQYGGTTSAANDGHIDYDAIAAAHGGRAEHQSPRPMTGTEAAGAVSTGFNRGVFAQLPGLIADTGANILDLGRAAYGTAGRATGLLRPEDMPSPLDRSKVIGSSQWLYNQMQRNPITAAAVTNPRPDVGAARVLNAGRVGSRRFLGGQSGQCRNAIWVRRSRAVRIRGNRRSQHGDACQHGAAGRSDRRRWRYSRCDAWW
jgi:hypothetical protein